MTIYPLKVLFCYNKYTMKNPYRVWERHERLTILEIWKPFNNKYHRMLKCRCDCWNIKNILSLNFRRMKSCWCFRSGKEKHWLARTRFYNIWEWINQRTWNPKSDAYENYWFVGSSFKLNICCNARQYDTLNDF